MLTVQQGPKRPRRVTEKSFEDAFGKALLACGFKNWHVNMRDKGWPDRYVRHGIWIEFKSLDAGAKLTARTSDQLDVWQKIRMVELAQAGDRVFYAARYDNQVIFSAYPFPMTLPNLPRFAYKDKRDLEQIIRMFIC